MEEQVLDALRRVNVGERDLVAAGLVKDLSVDAERGGVSFALVPRDPSVRDACLRAIEDSQLGWLRQAPTIKQQAAPAKTAPAGLEGVRKVVAVSSCKGGVGKSTVAVNLAMALGEKWSVGLLDADIYGPSLPTMMVEDGHEWAVTRSRDKRMINPVSLHGLRCMSYGLVAPGTGGTGRGGAKQGGQSGGAAVLRGPMVSNIVTQLLTQTEWGELDFLVVDMPPGTGDIGISLAQQVKIDTAVIVTTPQRLAFVDVVKGLEMFSKLQVSTAAVVENMAWFDGDDGKRYFPFGRGHREELAEDFGIKHAFSLPILNESSASGDAGRPFFAQHRESEAAGVYRELASAVEEHLALGAARQLSTLRFDEARGELVLRSIGEAEAREYAISPVELRRRVRRVDEMLGSRAEDVPEDVRPLTVTPVGNYAVTIQWSDGHEASIYPFEDVLAACQALEEDQLNGARGPGGAEK